MMMEEVEKSLKRTKKLKSS